MAVLTSMLVFSSSRTGPLEIATQVKRDAILDFNIEAVLSTTSELLAKL